MPSPLPDSYRGPGLRVRFHAIRGVTAKGVLTTQLYLPVVLGEFTVQEDFDHTDYGTVSAGEFSLPGAGPPSARLLRTSDLDTMTIDWHAYARFLSNPQISPEEAQREILKLARSKTPFEVLAALRLGKNQPEELRMYATIRSMSRTLRPGEADTRYFTLSLKEWRNNKTGRREHAAHGEQGRKGHHLPTFHILKAGDTLHSLSKHYYGTPNLWKAIAQANQIRSWGASTPLVDSKKYKVGDKVVIPLKPDATRFFPMGEVNGRNPVVRTPVSRLPR